MLSYTIYRLHVFVYMCVHVYMDIYIYIYVHTQRYISGDRSTERGAARRPARHGFACVCIYIYIYIYIYARIPFGDHPLKLERYREY